MSSLGSTPEPPSLEELSTRGITALLVPWILNLASSTGGGASVRDVAVFVHQPTRSITLVEGSVEIEAILREIPAKQGHLPASKVSIESLPEVQAPEPGLECPICLSDCDCGGGVKEMPCKHKFHGGCIEKWLGIHGSCPVCRFSMPAEEEGLDGRGEGLRIHMFFSRAPDPGPDADTGRDGDAPDSAGAVDDDSASPAENT